MTMSRTYHRARIAVGTILLAVLILLPFLRVNGQSAFRFDVPTLRLFFFGTVVWMEDFFLILVLVLALTFLTLFLTTAFGRIWCGWLCPQTVLVDLTPFLEGRAGRLFLRRSAAYLAAGGISAAVAVSLVGYFVSPYEIIPTIRSGGTAAAVVTICGSVLFLLIFLDLIALRRTFCSTVCPYAKLQGVLFDDRTLRVAFDKSRENECLRCAACVRSCPVGIDIRQGMQSACIHCAECVDACRERMAAVSRPTLVDYWFGDAAGDRRGIRISLYLSGIMAVATLAGFVYLAAVRMPYDATVAPVYSGASTASSDRTITNHYLLSIRNVGAADLRLTLSVTAPAGTARVLPESILLAREQESLQVPVTITVSGNVDTERRYLPLILVIQQEHQAARLKKPISFLLPER